MACTSSLKEAAMITMQNIIYNNYKTRNPLAQGVKKDEIKDLIKEFNHRLSWSGENLEPSEKNLTLLFSTLKSFYAHVIEGGKVFSEDEHLQIVREVTAYFGYVVLLTKGGEWDNPGGLLEVGIRFSGDFKSTKGGKTTSSKLRVENIGYLAASIWDGVLMGIDLDIMKPFNSIAQKRIKETL
jgi:hypothetical protein